MKKNAAAVALGRLGGKAGTGKAKARSSKQARAAAMARWKKEKRMNTLLETLKRAGEVKIGARVLLRGYGDGTAVAEIRPSGLTSPVEKVTKRGVGRLLDWIDSFHLVPSTL